MTTLTSAHVIGTDQDQLAELRASGVDHNGQPVEAFIDSDGGWPLRCCLRDARPGDELAIVGWSPFGWRGAYATTGPVVIHARVCPQPADGQLPAEFEDRWQVLRAYGVDHRLVYDLNRIVEPGDGISRNIDEMLADSRVQFVQGYNVLPGCYSFTASR